MRDVRSAFLSILPASPRGHLSVKITSEAKHLAPDCATVLNETLDDINGYSPVHRYHLYIQKSLVIGCIVEMSRHRR